MQRMGVSDIDQMLVESMDGTLQLAEAAADILGDMEPKDPAVFDARARTTTTQTGLEALSEQRDQQLSLL